MSWLCAAEFHSHPTDTEQGDRTWLAVSWRHAQRVQHGEGACGQPGGCVTAEEYEGIEATAVVGELDASCLPVEAVDS